MKEVQPLTYSSSADPNIPTRRITQRPRANREPEKGPGRDPRRVQPTRFQIASSRLACALVEPTNALRNLQRWQYGRFRRFPGTYGTSLRSALS